MAVPTVLPPPGGSPGVVRLGFEALGCRNEIVVADLPEGAARAACAAAIAEVRRIEAKYSRYRADSWLGRVNATAGQAQQHDCDAETTWLLDFVALLHRESGGRFDPTAGVLTAAWDFRAGIVPAAEQLDALRRQVGWARVERRDGRLRLPQAGMALDFGGFGKEYAADRAAQLLQQAGVARGYVNLGGDLMALGPQADGQPWQVGIADPRQPGALIATLPLYRGGLATSGDYERYFERDGRRYCHILDPLSGWPVAHWRSVSVLAPLCLSAGACSTVAMLLQDQGLDFLQRSGFTHLAVGPDGALHAHAAGPSSS